MKVIRSKINFKDSRGSISDIFYNIQLDISKSGIMEKGYQKVKMMIT